MGSDTICRVRAVVALVAGLALAALSAAAASADSGGVLWSGSTTQLCPEYGVSCEIIFAEIPLSSSVTYINASYNAISLSEGVSVYLKVQLVQDDEYLFMPDLTDPRQFLTHENLTANFCASTSESACTDRRGLFLVYPGPGQSYNTAYIIMVIHNHYIPVEVQLSGIIEYGVEPQGILPVLSDEYFQPYSYDRNPQSPLTNVGIDVQHVVRSVVTVLGFFSENNFLGWIAAFAVIFILLSAFINYLVNKFRGG